MPKHNISDRRSFCLFCAVQRHLAPRASHFLDVFFFRPGTSDLSNDNHRSMLDLRQKRSSVHWTAAELSFKASTWRFYKLSSVFPTFQHFSPRMGTPTFVNDKLCDQKGKKKFSIISLETYAPGKR